jgi:hypothetical protein
VAAVLLVTLVVPWLFAPLLALAGTASAPHREGFTTLMRWGIFPVVLVFAGHALWVLVPALRRGTVRLAHPAVLGFGASLLLTLTGFGLGAMIRGPTTLVPAHYHASIGAVTVAFMAVTPALLQRLGWSIPHGRLSRLAAVQPALFGAGQLIFAVGFGAAGSPRKVYGSEQAARGLAETIGLTVMGVGGLVAVAGGALFLIVVVAAWLRRDSTPVDSETVLTVEPRRSRPNWAEV